MYTAQRCHIKMIIKFVIADKMSFYFSFHIFWQIFFFLNSCYIQIKFALGVRWCICGTVKYVPMVWIFYVARNILGKVLSLCSCGLYASIAKWLIMMWWSILLKPSSWFGSDFWWLRKEIWDEWTEWYGVCGRWGESTWVILIH